MAKRKIIKQNRSFKGVWIPKEIWLAEDLSPIEILVLTEIQSLDNDEGCTASNSYLAGFFGVTRQRISQIISSLKDKKYIKISYDKDGDWCKGRVIKVVNNFNRGCKENLPRCKENLPGCKENFNVINTNNNTSNNTSINNKRDIREKSEDFSAGTSSDNIPYSEIVDYLNKRTGKKYRASSQKTKRLIKARFNEKYTVDDFKKVIDNKCLEWLRDDKMSRYLRPETLFGTKFESYLNQDSKNNQVPNGWANYYKDNGGTEAW